jgi:cytochrome c peroxidase
MSRFRSSFFVLTSTLGFASCEGGSSSSSAPPSELEVEALRHELFAAGVTPIAEPPQVSDELFELGRMLFFDPILSGNQDVSCATCHLPQFGTSDGRNLAAGVHGLGLGPERGNGVMIARNSPALFDVHLRTTLFWDGRAELDGSELDLPEAVELSPDQHAALRPEFTLLAAQAMLPPVSREEMRGEPADNPLGDLGDGYGSSGGTPGNTQAVWFELLQRVVLVPEYVQQLRAAYPEVQFDLFNFGHVGNALAAFQARAFARHDSPFERFVRGDDQALTRSQVRGALVFFGEGCARCHSGPLLTDDQFHNTGLPQIGPGFPRDPFGHAGNDLGRENSTGLAADRFTFRTPSLRNVALTAPYGHAGQFARLDDMIAHYEDPIASHFAYDIQSNVADPELVTMLWPGTQVVLGSLDPRLFGFNDIDVDAVVDFLEALTADDAADLEELIPTRVPSGLPVF